eukprot:17393-Pyramimonas_sp.AAC.1
MFAHQRGGKGHPTATKHTGPDEASMGAATMMAEAVDHTGKQQNRLEIKEHHRGNATNGAEHDDSAVPP